MSLKHRRRRTRTWAGAPWGATFGMFVITGCAPMLGAEASLFPASDAIGPLRFAEGVWMQESSSCAERRAQSSYSSAACTGFELRQAADGAWLLHVTHPSTRPNETGAALSLRVVLAPASELPRAEAPAPLYVAEYVELTEAGPSRPSYVALAPAGRMPAREFYLIPILCSDALREPPIAGVSAQRDGEGRLVRCDAMSQSAVRSAARRAPLEHLDTMQVIRFTWRRSNRSLPDLLVDCALPQSVTRRAECGEDPSP